MALLPRRVAPRLVLGTTILVALGCIFSAWLNLSGMSAQLLEEKRTAAEQLSRSITSSTWHTMRAGRKGDAYEVMASIGEEQGVDYIRMFGRHGRVAFSTDPEAPEQVGPTDVTCRACHETDPPREALSLEERVRMFTGENGRRKMAILTPILNEPACSTADCHAHPAAIHVLGTLDIALDLDHVDAEVHSLQAKAFLVTFSKVVVIAAFLVFFIQRLVGRPIRKLIKGTRAVGALELEQAIDVKSPTELGELADAFNTMQARLRAAREKNVRFTEDLERQVEERSQLLHATQEQLIQSDRLASLGQLSASVAHEVNNPLSAVLNLSIFLQRILTDDGVPPERLPSFRRHLAQIADETARAARIVTDLLAFSRRSMPQREPADLNEIVERTIALVRHRAELTRVRVDLELAGNLPFVSCDRSQIEQVILNLVLNAVEAIEASGQGGRVVVRTGVEEATEMAVIQVEDDGPGIAEEHVRRIFDPFFSTKEGEKGVGLGLSVAYGIVDAHDGRLNVYSEVGKGTTFNVRLPLRATAPAEEETGS